MYAKHWLSAAVGGLALALWAIPAGAAPISGATNSIKATTVDSSIVQEAHWRRGHRYYYGGYYPSYYRYPTYSYYYPYPSYYYSYPSYGFYYAPRYRHHYRHYRRW
jgi:hypothetical protein